MAYTAVVSVVSTGSLSCRVTITETEGASASEVELVDSTTGRRPLPGWLQRCVATRSAGTAATRQPRLGRAASATGADILYQATATAVATTIDDGARTAFPILLGSGKLFHRSQPNAGSDNSMVTVYDITATAGG